MSEALFGVVTTETVELPRESNASEIWEHGGIGSSHMYNLRCGYIIGREGFQQLHWYQMSDEAKFHMPHALTLVYLNIIREWMHVSIIYTWGLINTRIFAKI